MTVSNKIDLLIFFLARKKMTVEYIEDDNCPVCHRRYDRDEGPLRDGPSNSDMQTDCTHFLCVDCWSRMYSLYRLYGQKPLCPVCKEECTEWLESHYPLDLDEEE